MAAIAVVIAKIALAFRTGLASENNVISLRRKRNFSAVAAHLFDDRRR